LLFGAIGCTFACQRLVVAGVTLKRELIIIATNYTHMYLGKDLVCPKEVQSFLVSIDLMRDLIMH
jgi:hypothetical protein